MTDSKFVLTRVSGAPVSTEELLKDLQATAKARGKTTVGQKEYRKHGKFDDTTVRKRFGSWNNALKEAGLAISNESGISDDQLFENILSLWQHYGRQPRRSELAEVPSSISQSPYNRRFGSWLKALEAFVEYANSSEAEVPVTSSSSDSCKTSRDPNLKLRWLVLQRDHFTCCGCGASPANDITVKLHVDHIVPWSKGGETVFENLQTLCEKCNLGKSNG
jgi:5-methylcytosine-specific restriction endonuclease McrA